MAVENLRKIDYANIRPIKGINFPNLATPRRWVERVLQITAVRPPDVHTNGHNGRSNGHIIDLGEPIILPGPSNGHKSNGKLNGHENGHLKEQPKTLKEKIVATQDRLKELRAKMNPILEEKKSALKQAEDEREIQKAQAKAAKDQFIAGLAQTLVDQNDLKSKPRRNFKDSGRRRAAYLTKARSEARKIFKNLKNGDLALSTLDLSLDLSDELIEQLNQIDQAKAAEKAASKAVARAKRELKPWEIWEMYLGAQVTIEGYRSKTKSTQDSIKRKIDQLTRSGFYDSHLFVCHEIISSLQSEFALADREIKNIIPKEVLTGKIATSSPHRELISELLQHTQKVREMLVGEDISPIDLNDERDRLRKQVQQLKSANLMVAFVAVLATASLTRGVDVSSIGKTISGLLSDSSQSQVVRIGDSPSALFSGLSFYNEVLTLPIQQVSPQPRAVIKPGFVHDQETGIFFPANGKEAAHLMNQINALSETDKLDFMASVKPGTTLSPLDEATTTPATATSEPTITATSIPEPTWTFAHTATVTETPTPTPTVTWTAIPPTSTPRTINIASAPSTIWTATSVVKGTNTPRVTISPNAEFTPIPTSTSKPVERPLPPVATTSISTESFWVVNDANKGRIKSCPQYIDIISKYFGSKRNYKGIIAENFGERLVNFISQLIAAESVNCNPRAENPKTKASGLLQILPEYYDEARRKWDDIWRGAVIERYGYWRAIEDPNNNLEFGAEIFDRQGARAFEPCYVSRRVLDCPTEFWVKGEKLW